MFQFLKNTLPYLSNILRLKTAISILEIKRFIHETSLTSLHVLHALRLVFFTFLSCFVHKAKKMRFLFICIEFILKTGFHWQLITI